MIEQIFFSKVLCIWVGGLHYLGGTMWRIVSDFLVGKRKRKAFPPLLFNYRGNSSPFIIWNNKHSSTFLSCVNSEREICQVKARQLFLWGCGLTYSDAAVPFIIAARGRVQPLFCFSEGKKTIDSVSHSLCANQCTRRPLLDQNVNIIH